MSPASSRQSRTAGPTLNRGLGVDLDLASSFADEYNTHKRAWTMANSDVASVTHRFLPILDWAPGYRRDWLVPDVLAGLALWAVMVPEGMAYSGIVGVPPIMGLYTIVPALVAYAVLGTSRQLVVGPDTATGLISAVTVGAIASQGTVEFNSLTSTLAVLIGFFFLCFGIMRMGWVASFIPTPVMRGFIEGLVYVTIIGQAPHLLGISGASGNFFTKLWHILATLAGRFGCTSRNRHPVSRGDGLAPPSGSCDTGGARRHGHSDNRYRTAWRRGGGCACGRPPPIRVAPPDLARSGHLHIERACAWRARNRAGRLCRGARGGKSRRAAERRYESIQTKSWLHTGRQTF